MSYILECYHESITIIMVDSFIEYNITNCCICVSILAIPNIMYVFLAIPHDGTQAAIEMTQIY